MPCMLNRGLQTDSWQTSTKENKSKSRASQSPSGHIQKRGRSNEEHGWKKQVSHVTSSRRQGDMATWKKHQNTAIPIGLRCHADVDCGYIS
ncbi:hypothetical protein BJX62DRAFT_190097 [Aspergillus germanicus]